MATKRHERISLHAMFPRAYPLGQYDQTQAGWERDRFQSGMCWALCFFPGRDDPQAREFRPPTSQFLSEQSVAVYIPYQALCSFVGHRTVNMALQLYLYDPTAHCRLKVYSCDHQGMPINFRHTFYAYWDRACGDEHFKFVGDLGSGSQRAAIAPGTYFIEAEFYRAQAESSIPDTTYTTGMFHVAR